MSIEIKAPTFPESIADGTVATWRKKVGELALRDEVIAEIETDKVVLEIVAPQDGVLTRIVKLKGDTVVSDELLAEFNAGATGAMPALSDTTLQKSTPATVTSSAMPTLPAIQALTAEKEQQLSAQITKAATAQVQHSPTQPTQAQPSQLQQSPAVRKALAETGINAADITGTGRGARLTKADVVSAIAVTDAPATQPAAVSTPTAVNTTSIPAVSSQAVSLAVGQRIEKRVPMTRLRAKVAERLLAAAQGTAMLTTFNEVNMKPVMDMRKAYGERFEKRHGTRLGFMSFFVKAATEALKRNPAINASIDNQDIVYHGYYDIGVAVSSDRGLVVPVLRDTDRMDLAEIEKNIVDFGLKAKEGKLNLDDLTGGTFTISNGGVFGSLMSTPLLNPPQAAILGMHKIQERPMAVGGQVVILPMMYLALSYDHRLIDGKEAVTFLATIKNLVEDPALLLLDL